MVRLGKLSDKKAVLKIYEGAKSFIKSYNSPQWQSGYPNEESFLNDLSGNRLYVVEDNSEVVAVASFFTYDSNYDQIEDGKWLVDTNNYLAVHTIAVSSEYRGKKATKQFFDYIENNFSVDSIRIDTHEMNEPMLKMLNNNDFKYCGIVYVNDKNDPKRLAFERIIKK